MSLSPAKQRTLSRQTSSTSLNVGIPPPLPESTIMTPSTSSRSLKRTRSKHRIHRGDVESSATSADEFDESDADAFLVPSTMVKASASSDINLTPRRKVAGPIEPATVGRGKQKRETLQERLANAAKVKKSRSVGDGLAASASSGDLSLGAAGAKLEDAQSTSNGGSGDKVVVCVRIKPTSSPFQSMAYDLTPTSLALSDGHPNVVKRGGKQGREHEYEYTFALLLQQPSTTPDLYSAQVAPLVDKAMNGFNSTVFAYGQTGSGKSFTMTGHPAELGIIPCAVDGVFDAITADTDRAFLLRVSYIEIYNETLRDLLNFKKGSKEVPAIHTNKGKVYVEPLVEEVVSTPQDVMKLLGRGNEGRKVGATDWNDRSSRSHCVFTIVIESRPRDGNGDDDIRLSRLNLIDLAGSEKAVSDLERRGEGKHINQSLLALREVINKLTEKKRSHIPYRNSKLTHLLENALGGDSNICVICTISAEEEHASETLETLKFAGRCSQVETKAKKNVLLSSERALIRAKDAEIEELKRRLQSLAGPRARSPSVDSAASGSHAAELAESVADLENRKARLKDQLAKLNGEILTSELPRLGMGLALSPPRPKRRRISEFLGIGKPKVVGLDRRAVSGLRPVQEDSPMLLAPPDFEAETVESLRRALSSRDEELDRLRLALGLMQSQQASSRTTMLDTKHDLEITRTDLVFNIQGKSAQIDDLEETILDLRKSREDLLIEDQLRLDEVQRKLDTALMDLDRARRVETGDLPGDLAIEQEAHRLDLVQLRKSHKIEVERMHSELRRVGSQFRERWTVAERAISERKAVETRNLELQRDINLSREAVERYDAVSKDRAGLQEELEAVREQAKRVDFLESANKALRAELERLEGDQKRMLGLDAELAAAAGLKGTVRTLEADLTKMQADKDTLRAEKVDTAAKVAELELALMTARDEAAKRASELEQRRIEAEQRLDDFQRKTMSTESEAIAGLNLQLSERTTNLDTANDQLGVVKGELEEVQQRLAAIASDSSKTAEHTLSVQRDLLSAQMQVETRTGELEHANTQLASLRVELAQVHERIEEDIKAAIDAKEHAVRAVTETQGQLTALELECSTMREAAGRAQTDRRELQSRLEVVQAERVGSVKAAADLLKELAEKNQQLLEAISARDSLSTQFREASDATSGKDEIVRHLQADLAKLADELDGAKAAKSALTGELEALRTEVEQRRASEIDTIAQLRQACSTAESRISQIQSEAATLTASLRSAREDTAELSNQIQERDRQLAKAVQAAESHQQTSDEMQRQLRSDLNSTTDRAESTQVEITALVSRLSESAGTIVKLEEAVRAATEMLHGERTKAIEAQAAREGDAGALLERLRLREEASQELVKQLADRGSEVQALERKLAAAVEGMCLEGKKLAEAERAVADLRRAAAAEAASTDAKIGKLQAQLSDQLAVVDQAEKALVDLRVELQAARAMASTLSETSGASAAQLALSNGKLAAAQDALRSKKADLATLTAAAEASQNTSRQLREDIDDLTRQLERQTTAVLSAQRSADEDKARHAQALAESRDKGRAAIDTLEAQVRKQLSVVASLESRIQALSEKEEVEVEIRQASSAEINGLKRKLEEQSVEISSLTRATLDAEIKWSTLETELRATAATAETSARAQADLNLARAEVTAVETKLSISEADLTSARSRISALTKELADARMASAHSLRGSSRLSKALPTIHSSTSLSDLVAGGSGSKRRSLTGAQDKEEVERLEKVIEAQQAVIDDQREKIKFWSNELEKQREVVKLLTSAPEGQTTPTGSVGTRHMKAHSIASPTGVAPTAPGQISGMPKKSLTSTFTARNLALPTLPTPLPMPMHTAQYSNTTSRKGRRVTIDHEMGILSETSKVELTKAMFESPDKASIRAGVSGWSDSPKQRRP